MSASKLDGPAQLPPRLRVALFSGNYNYTRDGANLALNRLVDHLESVCGCQVRVYSPTTARPAFAPTGALLASPSIAIPLRPDYRLATGLPRATRDDLIRFAPDLFHLSAPDALAWQALGIARQLGAPVVASLHTRFDSYLPYYRLSWLVPLARAYLGAFYRRCDYVLAPTAPAAEIVDAKAPNSRVRIWSRGVDDDVFNPSRRDRRWRLAHGFSDDDVLVLFLGRLVKEKGLAVFAEAVTAAVARNPRIRCVVIGAGPQQGWFAQRLPRSALFTGPLSGPALGRAVASADIMFNPSVTETFGNVTLEAMAAGLPIVCADVPVQRALVTPSCGLTCTADDFAAYAEALLDLAANPAKRRALGAAGLQESARYSWPAALEQAVAAYSDALAA